jgi:EmrB/QacA subfamily drug resistance transporter
VLAIVCSAQLILAVDITIILVADVQIKQALGFSEVGLSWIVTAYALTFGGLLLLAGRLSDSFGHRRMFMAGMIAFGIASACAALSANPLELVLSRAAQGISASVVSPAALALLGDEFTEGTRRSRAFGFWAASGSAGGVIGYTVGGVIVGNLGWRWAFLINLPIAAAGVLAGRRYLPARPAAAPGGRFPALGAVAITVGVGLLIYALGQGQSSGWGNGSTLAPLAGAAVCIAAFVTHEARAPDPLIPLTVIRRRESAASVCAALQAATISAAVFLGSLYLQQVLGDSPQQVGVATLPVPLGVAVGAYTATRLLRRIRYSSAMVVAGFTLVAAGLAWIGAEARTESYDTVLLPGWAALGFGLALSQVPLASLATSGTTEQQRGIVAGVYNMAQQVGTAIGLAAFTVISVASAHGSAHVADRLHGLQVATLCTAALALAGVVFAALALPRHRSAVVPGTSATAQNPASRHPEGELTDDIELDRLSPGRCAKPQKFCFVTLTTSQSTLRKACRPLSSALAGAVPVKRPLPGVKTGQDGTGSHWCGRVAGARAKVRAVGRRPPWCRPRAVRGVTQGDPAACSAAGVAPVFSRPALPVPVL